MAEEKTYLPGIEKALAAEDAHDAAENAEFDAYARGEISTMERYEGRPITERVRLALENKIKLVEEADIFDLQRRLKTASIDREARREMIKRRYTA